MSVWARVVKSLGRRRRRVVTVPNPGSLSFTLQRLDPFGDGLPGDLYLDDRHVAATLENAALAIPAGVYQIDLTVSGRAQKGELWCPAQETHPDDKARWVLPLLLDVPGRDAIRIHALNKWTETVGCIGVGLARDGDEIRQSRAALIQVMATIAGALELGETVWIAVQDA